VDGELFLGELGEREPLCRPDIYFAERRKKGGGAYLTNFCGIRGVVAQAVFFAPIGKKKGERGEGGEVSLILH